MKPAFSVVAFTTVIGAAQGLVVLLALAVLAGLPVSPGFLRASLALAFVLLGVGLAASFGHLGRKERAWRAVLMWRTSWLSREVIVLPTFMASVAAWWLALSQGVASPLLMAVLPVAALLLAALLWYCTAMIYACLRFIQEWAQPLTIVNFALIGLASGLVLASALAAVAGEARLLGVSGPAALAATLLAALTRWMSLQHNARIVPRSTLQSATGIRSAQLQQKSMGMSAGAFNTREFFHGASGQKLRRIRLAFLLLGFALPALLAAWGIAASAALPWVLAVLVQAPGLLAERWFFFAQARHPQNLYYQVVS